MNTYCYPFDLFIFYLAKNVCDVHKGYGTKEEESLLSHISQS